MTLADDAALVERTVARLRAAGCVFAEEEAALVLAQAAGEDDVDALVARRAAGEPLEHVLGWAAFCGLRVGLAPGVFVPRVRTEHCAAQAVALAADAASRRPDDEPPVVVDLCCGSGALALVVATRLPDAVVHAADVDPVAVACARDNLDPLGVPVHLGDLDAPLPEGLRGRVDVLVANVPYVPTAAVATMPAEARQHESLVALDGGEDGLDVVRRVADLAPRWLRAGGAVLVETTDAQAPAAAEAFARAGLTPSVVTDAELEATVVVGIRR